MSAGTIRKIMEKNKYGISNKAGKDKKITEEFKIFYALALVGQIGFLIIIPILAAILGGRYIDRVLLDKYLWPEQHILHYIFIFALTFLAIVFSAWQIHKLISPLREKKENNKKRF